MPKPVETGNHEHPGYKALRERLKCLTPACTEKENIGDAYRGLCMRCYSEAKKLVESGQTTWEQLADVGLAKANETPFQRAFREKVQGGKVQ